jgi:hypothetical protein
MELLEGETLRERIAKPLRSGRYGAAGTPLIHKPGMALIGVQWSAAADKRPRCRDKGVPTSVMEVFGHLGDRVRFVLGAQCHQRLDSNRVQNLLEAGNTYRLVIVLFVSADHLLVDAQPPCQFRLRNTFRDPDFRDKGCDLVKSLDVRQD